MELYYKIDCKFGIIFERINGVIKLNELIDFHKSIFFDSKYNKSYSIFSDIRGSVFELSESERKVLYDMLSLSGSDNQRCAFLTDTPREVVSSELVKIAMQHFSAVNIKTFSTKAAAFQWLNIDKNYITDFD
ncbi:STAS/SEC14 domain-containing protein [bacterium]|nr:STAS/SEC14 domain-containing protein [bacterium]